MMSKREQQPLSMLLHELQRRVQTEPLSADEQATLMQVVTDLLQAGGKAAGPSLSSVDMREVYGHPHVKRALEVGAAGGHHVLLNGPHQAGKTVLARTLPSVLPAMMVPYAFRSPDSTLSITSFVGEATAPGELTRAHGGVLFLKNVQTFAPAHLAALRDAIEAHAVPLHHGEEDESIYGRKLSPDPKPSHEGTCTAATTAC